MYGSVAESQTFLDNALWNAASSATKTEHLTRASMIIDSLNYYDQKKVSTQEHEFPRTNETVVPQDIEYAAYYIALELFNGFDEEKNAESFTDVSTARASRGRLRKPIHLRAGVPSIRAWQLLFKYLRIPSIKLERIS